MAYNEIRLHPAISNCVIYLTAHEAHKFKQPMKIMLLLLPQITDEDHVIVTAHYKRRQPMSNSCEGSSMNSSVPKPLREREKLWLQGYSIDGRVVWHRFTLVQGIKITVAVCPVVAYTSIPHRRHCEAYTTVVPTNSKHDFALLKRELSYQPKVYQLMCYCLKWPSKTLICVYITAGSCWTDCIALAAEILTFMSETYIMHVQSFRQW